MKLGIVCLLHLLILGCNESSNNKIDLDGVFIARFDYKKEFERFWYISTIYIDKNNQSYQFIQSTDCLVGYGSSNLDEENLEVIRDTNIELVTSAFYRDFFSKKDGYHVGGDIYTNNDTSSFFISFRVEGDGFLVSKPLSPKEKKKEEEEEVDCIFTKELRKPYICAYNISKLSHLSEQDISNLKFKKYTDNKFPVGYCE